MVTLDEAVLHDPARLAAVARARRIMPVRPAPFDAIAALAARLLHAPMGVVTLVGDDEEYFIGRHGLPGALTGDGRAPIEYSLCKFAVCEDHPIRSADLLGEPDPRLCEHLLATEYGVRAFLGVPVRDGEDNVIGSLTVLDTATRDWSDDQASVLVEIAEVLHGLTSGVIDAPPAVATLDVVALLDGLQEAFLAVDPDGVIIGWNRAAQDLLGFSAAEICGRHLDDTLIPEYDGQPVGEELKRLLASPLGRTVSGPVTLRHRDGRRLTVGAALSVVPAATGPLGCAFLDDLSRQAATEEAADRSSSFLGALLESLTAGVTACDSSGRVVLVNRTLRDVLELPLTGDVTAEYTAAGMTMTFHTDGTAMALDQTPLIRALRENRVVGGDVVFRVPGRPARTFAANARPIIGADGRTWGAVVATHEVTAVRRTERFRSCHAAVARALGTASSAAEAAPAVLEAVATSLDWPYAELWLIDEATGDLRSVGHWSPPGVDLSGLLSQTAVKGVGIAGRVWATGTALWVPDLGDIAHGVTQVEPARADACLRHGIRTALAVPVRDGDELLGVLTCYAGAPEHQEDLLTVLLDGIAAQIGMFVALRRAENLARQLARAQDDFIALVGHEVRTPLTSITANVAMLGEDSGGLTEEHRMMVQAIERNTTVMRDTIDTLLDLAGLDSGQVNLQPADLDITAVVAQAVAAAAPAAAANGIRIDTRLPERLLIHGDGTRLRQVADELLSNAIKYSPQGSEVSVHLDVDSGTVELGVTDEGIGTPPDEAGRLFDRFYRASNVRHHGTPGSGLGLSLTRAIVHLHGGTITLISRRPSGTTALVRIPVRIDP